MTDKVFSAAVAQFVAKREGRICGYCGKVPDGNAQINDAWLCHPDDQSKPDCYSLYQWQSSMNAMLRSLPEGTEVIVHF